MINFSFFLLTFVQKLSKYTIFQQDYHYRLREIDTGKYCYEQLKKQWNKRYEIWSQAPGTKTSTKALVLAVLNTYPQMFLIYSAVSIALSAVEFLNAQVMGMALKSLEHQPPDATFLQKLQGAGKLVFVLIFSQVFMTILKAQNRFIITLLTQRIKHGINGLIFDKVMMKSIQRDPTFSIGEITNITQVDVERIANMGNFVNRIVIAPVEILGGMVWLYFLVGNIIWMGIAVILLCLWLNTFLLRKYKMYRSKFLDAKDKRGKLINEVFSNIRYIKMSGLENYFLQKIQKIKNEELLWIKKDFINATQFIVLLGAAPLLFLVTIFGGYIYFKGPLDVALIFLVMQVYNIFKSNFTSLPYVIAWCLDLTVSGQRITFFLLSENIDNTYIKRIENPEGNDGVAIEIQNGNFYWVDPELKDMYQEEKDRIAESEEKSKRKKDRKVISSGNRRAISDERRALVTLRTRISNLALKPRTGSIYTAKTNTENTKSVVTTNSVLSSATLGLTRRDFGDSDEFENYSKMSRKFTEFTDEEGLNQSLLTKEAPEFNDIYAGIQLNLKNINLKIKKGQCVALIGRVGSGKSSLLSCLHGEMYNKLGTRVTVCGEAAYVAQKAWIPSGTLKETILFGREYDEQRYRDSIKFSCMTEDLAMLAKGDQTMLGDKGVNLSGGQKIRLSIARALYSNRDIYLFDDPISALDIHVGKSVMENGIIEYLKGKTRIVATHAIAYLKFFDYIYVLDDGEIIEEGTYEEITQTETFQKIKGTIEKEEEEAAKSPKKKKRTAAGDKDHVPRPQRHKTIDIDLSHDSRGLAPDSDYEEDISFRQRRESNASNYRLIMSTHTSMMGGRTDDSFISNLSDLDDDAKQLVEDIIQSEDRATGNMDWSVVGDWMRLAGGAPRMFFLTLVMIVWCFTKGGIPWFLQWWATNFKDTNLSREYQLKTFLGIYLSINLLQIICDSIQVLSIFMGNIEMSKEVNFMMTFRMMHASVNKYFDRVPIGRLLNRFLKDVQTIDSQLAWSSGYLVKIT